ncbi:class I SAM-dependent methyltransferase [Nocardioides korecus]
MAEQSAAASHWDEVYSTKDVETVSWHQRVPSTSLRLIGPPRRTLVDIGAGASPLVDHLLQTGWDHVTLLDVSATGLDLTLARLGDSTDRVGAVVSDVLSWSPARTYDVWHDRAVLHFLTDPADRAAYADLAARVLAPGGRLVIGGFAPDGPTHCSGMPTARRSADELAAEFEELFDLEHSEHETHVTPSKTEQSFTWVVLTRN